jgi:hypothetical protein
MMAWARGHKNDWDYFASEAGDPAWSYESVLSICRRIPRLNGICEYENSEVTWYPFRPSVAIDGSSNWLDGVCRVLRRCSYSGTHSRMLMPEEEVVSIVPEGRPPKDQPAWRKDFSLDSAEDEYRSRREFVAFLMLTSAAFVADQSGSC